VRALEKVSRRTLGQAPSGVYVIPARARHQSLGQETARGQYASELGPCKQRPFVGQVQPRVCHHLLLHARLVLRSRGKRTRRAVKSRQGGPFNQTSKHFVYKQFLDKSESDLTRAILTSFRVFFSQKIPNRARATWKGDAGQRVGARFQSVVPPRPRST
jgi:hypothetical protein